MNRYPKSLIISLTRLARNLKNTKISKRIRNIKNISSIEGMSTNIKSCIFNFMRAFLVIFLKVIVFDSNI